MLVLSNKLFFPSKTGLTGVGIVDYCAFGYADNSVDCLIEAPARFAQGNKITVEKWGGYSFSNYNCFIRAKSVGRFCSIAPNVSIGMGEHDYTNFSTSTAFEMNQWDRMVCFTGLLDDKEFMRTIINENNKKRKMRLRSHAGNVIIGNDVWVGTGVIIMSGVTIGDGAVIASGSVVTKDVEPYSIVGGVPAKTIKMRFNDKIIQKMMGLQWWNYDPIMFQNVNYVSEIEESVKIIEERIEGGALPFNNDKYLVSPRERKVYHILPDTGKKVSIYDVSVKK